MITLNLTEILKIIQTAKHPEDIFECRPGDTLKDVETRYKALARLVHPDRHDQASAAVEAMALVNILWARAEEKFAQGRWGKKGSGINVQATKLYKDLEEFAVGDISDIYLAEQDNGPRVVIKIGYPKDADLIQNEARVLKKLWKPKEKAALFTQQFLPKLLDQTRLTINGKDRLASIFEACEQGFTLEEVKAKYRDGLDPRHIAWIWRRMLEAMTWVHSQDIVHAALVPSHIIVYPKNHGICILDWSYACTGNQAVKAVVSKYRDMYPKEVFDKKLAKPSVDLYMMAQVAKYLLADKSGGVPTHIPSMFNAMIQACSLPAFHRSNDAREVYEQLSDNLRKVYGPRKFIEFEM